MIEDIGFCSITEDICRKEGECEKCSLKHIHENMEHYAKLHEQGRLIELPCAVGDEYWCTERDDGGEGPVIHKVHSEPFACLVKDLWGIKCFATKEEAERKLKELEGDKE